MLIIVPFSLDHGGDELADVNHLEKSLAYLLINVLIMTVTQVPLSKDLKLND